MTRKPQITVTGDSRGIYVRKNGVLVAHAAKRAGQWECFRVHGGRGPAPTASYQDTVRGKRHAEDYLVGLVA